MGVRRIMCGRVDGQGFPCRKRTEMRHVVNTTCVFFIVLCMRQVFSLSFDNTTESFIEKCRADCTLERNLVTCGKYRVVRWLHDIKEKEFSYGPLRIVRIPSMPQQSVLPILPRSRAFKSSIMDTLNFLRNSANDFLTKRVLVYTIENPSSPRSFGTGPMILDDAELADLTSRQESQGDSRLFKKKKALILPLLILINLIKVKLLLLPIVLGVHFIKKALVVGGLVVPSILSHLKVCKVPQQQQTYPHHVWATAAEAPVDYPSAPGYEQEDSHNWVNRNDFQGGHLVYPVYHRLRNPYG